MVTSVAIPTIVQEKLEAFERLRPEFEASFQFVQDVHGHRRLAEFPVGDIVRYLHARWICECKGHLLSVPRTVKEYEGELCLQLLRDWQQGDTASVVAFLHHRLDMLPVAQITRQIQEARHVHQDDGLAQRLEHGRRVLLNRGFNLMQALDAIFALTEEELQQAVCDACKQYGHQPEQIEQQLALLETPLYSYIPHHALAQRNIMVMNELGVHVTSRWADRPSHRSWRVLEPTVPQGPYAQQVIAGYQLLTAPLHNNLNGHRFVDRLEHYISEHR
jgi:hypothetical protein